MRLRARLVALWRTLVRPSALDRDLDDELRAYVELVAEKKIAAGMNSDAARADARRDAGSLIRVKEEVRGVRAGHTIEAAAAEVRWAIRGLRRAPGFTAAAVATLALGIGANTAIFSVVRAMLLAPLPYRDSSRLVFVWSDMTAIGYPRAPLSAPELKDLRDRTSRFDGFGSIWSTSAALTGDGDPEQLRVGLVSTNFFALLGADAAVGRTFAADDESTDAPRAIVLSHALWQRRYGADPSLVGRAIRINGQTTTVVGVMPAEFRLLMPPDAAVPDDLQAFVLLNPQALTNGPRGQQFLRVVGRMKRGVTLDEARRDVDAVAAQISREFTSYGANGRRFTIVGLQEDDVREIRPVLLALFGGVGILLLLACVNVAGLLVARTAARTRETALRLSLGASRSRLLRQCLGEGLALASLGAAAGLATGWAGLRLLLALRPAPLHLLDAASIDGAVLAFTMATSVAWGVLFSLAPLVELLRADPMAALQRDGRRAAGSVHYRLRSALVIVQIALGVVLLVGAALMLRSFFAVQRVDPGFRADGITTFRIALPAQRYRTADAFNAFSRELQAALAALPGVTAVGALSHVPYDNVPNWGGPYLSQPGQPESTAVMADNRAVTPGLFETIGVHLVDGRFFTEDDDARRESVVIVDDQLARRSWPGQSAIGQRVASDPFSTGHPVVWSTVVGVVRHLRHRSALEDLGDQIYFSERQVQRNPMAYFVRGGDPAALPAAIRRTVASLDGELPIAEVRAFDEYVGAARASQRFASVLALTFAGVALTLAAVGVYGLVAYATARRRYEFGVRLALGAQPTHVRSAILREGAALATAGAAAGLVASTFAARVLASQLYGVTAGDVASYAAATLAMVAATLAASWLPARRATAISPIEALRAE
ncbi:MAG TPA: ABC transporter permease [Vicinamibacterales bacterium]|nr:ABC transporter permease [Vicinamibacterales bacterium]